ncbi:MAG: hypothetical protein H7257_12175 [Taibaiella sp.]|nr:hypothetical protein [Taibaiella sp.]
MSSEHKKKIVLLTLVHPDFLPPVYACAQTLRDLNYDVHVLTFDSYVPADVEIGNNIKIEALGQHHNVPFFKRLKLRRKFAARAKEIVKDHTTAIISFCPFSFISGLKFKPQIPVVYFALEIADFNINSLLRSPLSNINNFIAMHRMQEADLVATPSVQRSAWLAGRCHLKILPETIFNTSYSSGAQNPLSDEIFKNIIPQHFQGKKIILYTGAANERLCVFELVKAFEMLNDQKCALIVTGMRDNKYCNEIKSFVNGARNKTNILLLPYVTREEMLSLQANADIGACLGREYNEVIASKMIAPNKVGEYLNKGLFILGTKCEYMNMFELRGVAALAVSPEPEAVCLSLKTALNVVYAGNYKQTISSFVQEYFCMQKQAAPIVNFLSNIK